MIEYYLKEQNFL